MDLNLIVGLILLLPLFGAVFNGLGGLFLPGLRNETLVGTVGTLVVAAPFLLALYLFAGFHGEPEIATFYTWMAAGGLDISFAYRIDQLSLIMTLIVTGVGALIHFYSIGYMHADKGFWRFFAYLNLFIFAMLNLVMADNLLVLFLGWEGVGLCSYLLIGFWYYDLKNSEAANKAFIVNRIGDFAFLLGLFLLFRELGGLDFDTILADPAAMSPGITAWVVLLLFIGATGKSAQIPLFVWLPDAMAGPTPVSALIHAATMVTSGLYLLARMSPLVLAAPGIMMVIAVVAALTALMAATIAITQNDIKKLLAYSTVSQLGFMFMAAGVGAFFVAIFHVMTHAFFKACLFLGAGSVIHGMHHVEHELQQRGVLPAHGEPEASATPLEGESVHEVVDHDPRSYEGHFDAQDIRTMGGLRKYMPGTSLTFLIATLAIAGFPPLAGFFSKDEILWKAFEYGYDGAGYAYFVWGIGIFTAFLTAFYMTRGYVLTFLGKPRWPLSDEVHPHESPRTMTFTLYALAFLSIVGGFLGMPAIVSQLTGVESWIHHWLGTPYGGPVAEPELAEHGQGFLAIELILLLLGAAIAIGGVFFAWNRYTKHGLAYDERLRSRFRGFYRLWERKYLWDEFYDRTVVQPVVNASRKILLPFDQLVVDGAVNGLATLARTVAGGFRHVQTGVVQNYALAIALGVVLIVALMLLL